MAVHRKTSNSRSLLRIGCGGDEADVGEAGAVQVLGKTLPGESVVSVEVDLVGVEGAVWILVEGRNSQLAALDEERSDGLR